MVHRPPAFWISWVVQPVTQVLHVLPGCQPRSIRLVEVRREPLAGLQVHVGHHKVQLRPVMIPVLYPDHGQPVDVHPRNQKVPLEAVDHLKAQVWAVL
jgi:hypothetical protein